MKIVLSWRDRYSCSLGRKPLYGITHNDGQGNVTPIGTRYPNRSIGIESPIQELGPLYILFWNKNMIKISSNCLYRHEVDRFRLHNLPGGEFIVELRNPGAQPRHLR